jgi:membrane-bound lytic murein transglycosylase C
VLVVVAIVLSVFSGVTSGQGSGEDDFERYAREEREAYDRFVAAERVAYGEWLKAERAAFARFKTEIEQEWDTYVASTEKDWVEYSEDLISRSVVDFEEGEVTVEVLVPDAEERARPGTIEERLRAAVERLVVDRGSTRGYSVGDAEPKPLSDAPVLEGQVRNEGGELVTEENAESFANETVASDRIEREVVDSRDGTKRVKATVRITLVPEHLRVRAERYVPIVKEYSARYRLDPALVFAIIQTESWFYPRAESAMSAYGLMQIVPTSGGVDAYEFAKGVKTVPTPDYLYVPRNNIELGTAYLRLLEQRDFPRVRNEESRLYCVVSAYNTGPANVSRGVNDSRDVDSAVVQINTMSSSAVYEKLIKDLPYEETRNYLALVMERVPLYEEWR